MPSEARVIERLSALYPEITNILGFHDLIDQGEAPTNFAAMTYQIHLTAAAVKLAREVYLILDDAKEPPL